MKYGFYYHERFGYYLFCDASKKLIHLGKKDSLNNKDRLTGETEYFTEDNYFIKNLTYVGENIDEVFDKKINKFIQATILNYDKL